MLSSKPGHASSAVASINAPTAQPAVDPPRAPCARGHSSSMLAMLPPSQPSVVPQSVKRPPDVANHAQADVPAIAALRFGRWTDAQWRAILRDIPQHKHAAPLVLPKPPLSWAERVAAKSNGPSPVPRSPPKPRNCSTSSRLASSSSSSSCSPSSPSPSASCSSCSPRSSSSSCAAAPGSDQSQSNAVFQLTANGGTAFKNAAQPKRSPPSPRRPRYRSTTLAAIYYERFGNGLNSGTSPLPTLPPRGLINAGNTCFVNVVLQALLACAPFRHLLFAMKDLPSLPPLLSKFVKLAVNMRDDKHLLTYSAKSRTFCPAEPLRPEWFDNVFPDYQFNDSSFGKALDKPGCHDSVPSLVRQGSQEDAEEFLTFALNKLHEELIARYDEPLPARNEFPSNSGVRDKKLSVPKKDVPNGKVNDCLSRDGLEDIPSLQTGKNGCGHANGGVMNGFVGRSLYHSLGSSDEDDEILNLDAANGIRRAVDGIVLGSNEYAIPRKTNGSFSYLDAANAEPRGDTGSGAEGNDDGGVWEEMTSKGRAVEVRNAGLTRSPITDIFGGVLRSELKRPNVKLSVTREPFFSLSLDIESGLVRDVEQSLTAYFEPERLEGYTLESTSETVEARKHVLLEALPLVLVLHLKRFSHNIQTGALAKLHRRMDFPELLEIPTALLSSPKVAQSVMDRTYELTAVVTHLGKELAGGHYTCDVRRETNGDSGPKWITCDDSKISPVTLQNVHRKQAYLLFYSRLGNQHDGSRVAL